MQRIYVHPLPVRIWHWVNAVGFVLMILTGLQIRYFGTIEVISLLWAVHLHNWTGFALIANFFVWLLYYLFSDRIRVYHPELNPKKHFQGTIRQAHFYGYGIFQGDPNPFHVTIYRKFNPLQSMLYQIIMMLVVPIQFYIGFLLYDAKGFSGQIEFLGGLRMVDTLHALLFIFFVAFLVVHIYLGALGHTPSAHYKAMFNGYEEVEDEDVTHLVLPTDKPKA